MSTDDRDGNGSAAGGRSDARILLRRPLFRIRSTEQAPPDEPQPATTTTRPVVSESPRERTGGDERISIRRPLRPQPTERAAAAPRLEQPAPAERISIGRHETAETLGRHPAQPGQPAVTEHISIGRRRDHTETAPGVQTGQAPRAATQDSDAQANWYQWFVGGSPWYRKPVAKAGLAAAFVLVAAAAGVTWYLEVEKAKQEAQFAWGRGNQAVAQNDPDKAITEYSQAIKLWPRFAAAYVSRGNAYLIKFEREKAMADYDAAIKQDADYPQAYLARGVTHALVGEIPAAEADFRRLVALRPDEPFYTHRLATVLYEQKRDQDAEDLYQQAYKQDTSREWALQAWLSSLLENPNRGAERVIDEVKALNARGVRTHITSYWIGSAYVRLRLYREAIPSLKHALEGDPAKIGTEAAQSLAQAYRGVGERSNCLTALADYAQRMGRSGGERQEFCDERDTP